MQSMKWSGSYFKFFFPLGFMLSASGLVTFVSEEVTRYLQETPPVSPWAVTFFKLVSKDKTSSFNNIQWIGLAACIPGGVVLGFVNDWIPRGIWLGIMLSATLR
jgi:hypothetical protein